ncbi:MAG: T9SS type A sorting domain-containing protein [Chlorobi bacterium]|nr:T9SS type A sorting domain-containing protein [Chlorobiota bacterium]
MKKLLLFSAFIFAAFNFAIFANGGHDYCGGGDVNPDSIQTVTVTGTAIVDDSYMHPMYYLDEDQDGVADYHLNFGPYWYEPDSSNATRPNDGDVVTITGGLHDSDMMDEPTIIVYDINGEFWREPYYADWNDMGRHSNANGHHSGSDGYCYGFGWDHDSLNTVTVSGTAIVDTTFMWNHYFLDENNDGTPEYKLNFGPYWYEPESGAQRPLDGDAITITGSLMTTGDVFDAIIVFEINGQVWRDSTLFGDHMGGGWFNQNMTGSEDFNAMFDNGDMITIHSGWADNGTNKDGGHGGGMNGDFPDSMFCQMFEVFPENIPNQNGMDILAGYELHMYEPDGSMGMMGGGCMDGNNYFGSDVDYTFHYSDAQLATFNADEGSINVKIWDQGTNAWVDANAAIDVTTNTVTFSTNQVSNYYVITYDSVLPVELASFTAQTVDNGVLLSWETATEINNKGFSVERSDDNRWEEIAFINGAGTSSEKNVYEYFDASAPEGNVSYRLVQIDLDGTITYSDPVEVSGEVIEKYSLEQNYPNPFNPSTVINYSIPVDGNVTLKIYDILGNEVAELVNGKISAGTHKVTFEASGFTSGIYFYSIQTDNFKATKKMILLK